MATSDSGETRDPGASNEVSPEPEDATEVQWLGKAFTAQDDEHASRLPDPPFLGLENMIDSALSGPRFRFDASAASESPDVIEQTGSRPPPGAGINVSAAMFEIRIVLTANGEADLVRTVLQDLGQRLNELPGTRSVIREKPPGFSRPFGNARFLLDVVLSSDDAVERLAEAVEGWLRHQDPDVVLTATVTTTSVELRYPSSPGPAASLRRVVQEGQENLRSAKEKLKEKSRERNRSTSAPGSPGPRFWDDVRAYRRSPGPRFSDDDDDGVHSRSPGPRFSSITHRDGYGVPPGPHLARAGLDSGIPGPFGDLRESWFRRLLRRIRGRG